MSKLLMLLMSMVFLFYTSYGQTYYTLSGTVLDENKEPLTGASVFLFPLKKGTIADIDGNFLIDKLPKDHYRIEVSFIGYKTFYDSIFLDKHLTRQFKLDVSALNLQEIVVKDNYIETRKKETSLNIEIVNEEYLKENLGGSLMNSLDNIAGVSSIDIGSGQSKPVIRGLGFNRVLVIENNINHEAQQWGSDHGLEIDQYAVDNIEIVKGPASLMYGSEAIGGVIDIKNRKIPIKNSFGGKLNLSGKTNNGFLGSSVSMYARKKWFYTSFRTTLIDYGDYKVPTDSINIYSYKAALHKNHLRNTAGKEQNLHLSLGIIQNQFQSKLHLSNVNSKNGLFANAHGLEPRNINAELHDKSNRDFHYPYQTVSHFKAINSSFYRWEKLKLELDFGFQRNFRQEWSSYVQHGFMPANYPDSLTSHPDLEREFEKYVYSANLKFLYQLDKKTEINYGLTSEYQNNTIDGRGFIIPAYRQFKMGTYVFSKYKFSDKSILQAGLRYDYGHISTSQYNDWFPSLIIENTDTSTQFLQRSEVIKQDFSNISWSVGYNYNLENYSFKVNIGKSFRIPIAKELAANGVNYHRFSYEVGNADLSPEISYQLDAGIDYKTRKFVMGTTPFINYFSNYIYLNPSSEHDRLYGNGNQIFYYTQSRVLRYGAEIHMLYEIFKSLQVGLVAEYVYSEQLSGEKEGFSLPFSPPLSSIFNIKYKKANYKSFKDIYVSLDYKITAAQNNIVPPEDTSEGHQIFNIGIGGDLVFKKQKINISMQVQNLLNSKYFNHTSYYRLINVPEQGRNFIINITIPFSGKIKKQ